MTLELSCYTTNLVAYLNFCDARQRLAYAVRLTVRTDLPDAIGFSHHERIDRTLDGRELAYRGAGSWAAARDGLMAELDRSGAVLAVANTRHLPWSPQYGRAAVPHWILLQHRDADRWRFTDHFAALLPEGEQRAQAGWFSDAGLRRALTPPGELAREVRLRDVYALGTEVALPPSVHYRWLARQAPAPMPAAGPQTWITDPQGVLEFLAERLVADSRLLAQHADDLWAAARHHCHRGTVLAGSGAVAPAAAERSARSWSALPRALRFAADSAVRGRPRPGVVTRAFDAVLEAEGAIT